MNAQLAELMQKARKESGLKQTDIGAKMGKTGAAISSWETGNADPDIDEFIMYCDICGADFVAMLTKVYGNPQEPKETIECTAREVDLIQKFRCLDERAQKVIIRNVNAEYEDAEKFLAKNSSIAAGVG